MFEIIKHIETIIIGIIFFSFWCRNAKKQYGQIKITNGKLYLPIEIIAKINPNIKYL